MKTRMRIGLMSVLVVVGGLVLPGPGLACVFGGPVKIEDLARMADTILLGKVVDQKSYFGVDGDIYTDFTIQVEADLKNPSTPAQVIVTAFGGRVGNLIAGDTCAAGLSLNERFLLFLKRDPSMLTLLAPTRLGAYWVKDDKVWGPNLDWLYGQGTAIPLPEFIAQIQAALTP